MHGCRSREINLLFVWKKRYEYKDLMGNVRFNVWLLKKKLKMGMWQIDIRNTLLFCVVRNISKRFKSAGYFLSNFIFHELHWHLTWVGQLDVNYDVTAGRGWDQLNYENSSEKTKACLPFSTANLLIGLQHFFGKFPSSNFEESKIMQDIKSQVLTQFFYIFQSQQFLIRGGLQTQKYSRKIIQNVRRNSFHVFVFSWNLLNSSIKALFLNHL